MSNFHVIAWNLAVIFPICKAHSCSLNFHEILAQMFFLNLPVLYHIGQDIYFIVPRNLQLYAEVKLFVALVVLPDSFKQFLCTIP